MCEHCRSYKYESVSALPRTTLAPHVCGRDAGSLVLALVASTMLAFEVKRWPDRKQTVDNGLWSCTAWASGCVAGGHSPWRARIATPALDLNRPAGRILTFLP